MLRAGFRFLTPKKQTRGDATSRTWLELPQPARYADNKRSPEVASNRLTGRASFLLVFVLIVMDPVTWERVFFRGNKRWGRNRHCYALPPPIRGRKSQAAGWIPAAELRFYTMRWFSPFNPTHRSTPSITRNKDCVLFPARKAKAAHPPAQPVTATSPMRPPQSSSLRLLSLPAPNLAILTAGISVYRRVELHPDSCSFSAQNKLVGGGGEAKTHSLVVLLSIRSHQTPAQPRTRWSRRVSPNRLQCNFLVSREIRQQIQFPTQCKHVKNKYLPKT